MCFMSRAAPAPTPEPITPKPPATQNLTQQSSPAPSEPGSQADQNTGTTIDAKKKGTAQLQIPLVSGTGSGLQVE